MATGLHRSGYRVSGDRVRAEINEFLSATGISVSELERKAKVARGQVSHILSREISDVTNTTASDLRRTMILMKREQAA